MINYIKKISVVLTLILLVVSCAGEKTIDEVFDTVERGAILRTISTSGSSFNVFDTNSSWSVELEQFDYEDGALFQEIEVYGDFFDRTLEEGEEDPGVDEVFIKTITASTFSEGPSGLPRGTISVTFQEVLDALNFTEDDYEGGDEIVIRLELVLTDGRRFSVDNTASTVAGGSFYVSPFQYTNLLACVPAEVPPGDWTIEMFDSYGDGWQTTDNSGGPGITVTLSNGETTEVGLCSPYAESDYDCIAGADPEMHFDGTAIINIPPGITSAEWFFPGDQFDEISFNIYAPGGNLVASYSPGSPAGPIALNLCNE